MNRPHSKRSAGFTVTEVVVVSLLIGILLAIAVPSYVGWMETSKANDIAGKLDAIGHAQKMHRADRGSYVQGPITSTCNTGTCGQGGACDLIRCRYYPPEDWNALNFNIRLCPNGCSGVIPPCVGAGNTSLAQATHKGGSKPYSNWRYDVCARDMRVVPGGGAPGPLK